MIVLILGSGPNVLQARDWDLSAVDKIVVINNAWAVRPDWDILIHPEDFPRSRRPSAVAPEQTIITAKDYVPLQNELGGFVYAGGTMAFTAGYWALQALAPTVIAHLGCDMVYADAAKTHFYGKGTADPLRDDISLRSLEAKSARLQAMAATRGCAMVNLSTDPSRLTYPRATLDGLKNIRPKSLNRAAIEAARAAERAAGYFVPSGRYWEDETIFDPNVIDRIDRLWLNALPPAYTDLAFADRRTS